MNKAELVDVIASKIDFTKKDIEKILDIFEETITLTLQKGEKVTLTGFGAFEAKNTKSRIGVNPQNPTEKITIPEMIIPKFRAGKTLKDAMKK